tara:strand:+ start:10562 stop:11326 length:765 start_codon:yes stop_codon:yes gene_type:complete
MSIINRKKFKTDYDMFASDNYIVAKNKLTQLFKSKVIEDRIKIDNLFLFTDPKLISRLLFFNFIYQKILNIPGYIFEFGTRYGNFASALVSMRDIYEPYNRTRKIIACDTFEGLKNITKKKDKIYKSSDFKTPEMYEEYLDEIFKSKENFGALPHCKRYEILKGDASKTVKNFLQKNKETVISMAFFDMDIYKPTKDVLKLIKPCLVKGSILVFDDAICELSTGETEAIKETFDLNKIELRRWQYNSRIVYFEI